jgi:peptide-methionine (S)-S-oxide reductase
VANQSNFETITLGGGCFWCTEAVFERVRGVVAVESGYANGHVPAPGYEQVCQGDTGHVEVIRVVFDPVQVGLRDLLEVFFAVHDPTTLNRQGNDVGTQYRSGIYWHDLAQVSVAQAVMDEVRAAMAVPLVTELQPLAAYWPAEAYHQRYFAQHPEAGYCSFVVAPKLAKFRKRFARLVQD